MAPALGCSDAIRSDIIEAFKLLYARQGMSGVSARALAEKSGYSRSTLYRHFPSIYDVLREVEDEAIPREAMHELVERADTLDMRTITDVFLNSFYERRAVICLLTRFEKDNTFFERVAEAIKPVFRAQAERVYVMTDAEYDLFAEYLTYAKLGLLRYWAKDGGEAELGDMTAITDSMLEGLFWDRVEQAYRSQVAGVPFMRVPISTFEAGRPWVRNRPGKAR